VDIAGRPTITMNDLTLEFLLWIARRPRTYAEAMEAWRSNCPRQSVWEDALLEGLIEVENGAAMNESKVTLTVLGASALNSRR
jgi:predicted transcriptional regulator